MAGLSIDSLLSPLETLPRELFSMIIDYVPNMAHVFRLTSRLIKSQMDEYAMHRGVISLVEQLSFSEIYRNRPNEFKISIEVSQYKATLFELRLTLQKPPQFELARFECDLINCENDSVVKEYCLKLNTKDDIQGILKYLSGCMGSWIRIVILRNCEHRSTMNSLATLLYGVRLGKLNVSIRNLTEGVACRLLAVLNAGKVQDLVMSLERSEIFSPVEFLLKLSELVRSLSIKVMASREVKLFEDCTIDWSSIILDMFSRKIDKFDVNESQLAACLTIEHADRLREQIPCLGKKVWFKVRCNAYNSNQLYIQNEHLVDVSKSSLDIVHRARVSEESSPF